MVEDNAFNEYVHDTQRKVTEVSAAQSTTTTVDSKANKGRSNRSKKPPTQPKGNAVVSQSTNVEINSSITDPITKKSDPDVVNSNTNTLPKDAPKPIIDDAPTNILSSGPVAKEDKTIGSDEEKMAASGNEKEQMEIPKGRATRGTKRGSDAITLPSTKLARSTRSNKPIADSLQSVVDGAPALSPPELVHVVVGVTPASQIPSVGAQASVPATPRRRGRPKSSVAKESPMKNTPLQKTNTAIADVKESPAKPRTATRATRSSSRTK